jgi:hypothetical protein
LLTALARGRRLCRNDRKCANQKRYRSKNPVGPVHGKGSFSKTFMVLEMMGVYKTLTLRSTKPSIVYSLFMSAIEIVKDLKHRERRLAWFVALAADAIQIVGLPLFGGGALSPADTVVDFATALLLTRLIGWHWAFFPTLIAEVIPGLDLFPTWTAAVFFVNRQHAKEEKREIRSVTPEWGPFSSRDVPAKSTRPETR